MKKLLPLLAIGLIATQNPMSPIGETQQLAPDISVTPYAVIEDSRCPPDVMCIQAGKLVVSAIFRNGETTQPADLELGGSMPVEGGMLTLGNATPPPPAGKDSDGEAEPAPLRVSYTFAPDTMN